MKFEKDFPSISYKIVGKKMEKLTRFSDEIILSKKEITTFLLDKQRVKDVIDDRIEHYVALKDKPSYQAASTRSRIIQRIIVLRELRMELLSPKDKELLGDE